MLVVFDFLSSFYLLLFAILNVVTKEIKQKVKEKDQNKRHHCPTNRIYLNEDKLEPLMDRNNPSRRAARQAFANA
jgi:hypothetical protein